MIDLYISYNVLNDCLIQQDNHNPLLNILKKKLVNVYVDIEKNTLDTLMNGIDSEGSSLENDTFTLLFDFINGLDLSLYSGHKRMEIVKNRGKLKPTTPSSAIFIFDKIGKDDIYYIENKYGVICLSHDYIPELSKLLRDDYQSYWDTEDNTRKGSWTQILQPFKFPCNTFIFCDLYLYKDDYDRRSQNVNDIIKALCLNLSTQNDTSMQSQINILFIWDEIPNKSDKVKWMSDKIMKVIPNGRNVRIEFLFCSKNNNRYKLHEHTHNRRLLTNFSLASADHSLAAFDVNGRPMKDQRLTYGTILTGGISNEYESILSKISNDIRVLMDLTDNSKECTYFACSNSKAEVKSIDLKNLKNRLILNRIMPIDEEKCYYLDVPRQNDWAHTKILSGLYNSDEYANRIVYKESKPLVEIQKRIIDLFSKTSIRNADDYSIFYQIVVSNNSDLRNVRIEECTCLESSGKICSNNYFINKKDALEVLYKLKILLKLDM